MACPTGSRSPARSPYKGQTLPNGTVNFIPESVDGPQGGRGATGNIVDGEYELTTLTPGDGVIPGSYFVSITAFADADTSGAEVDAAGGAMDQVSMAQASQAAKSLIPERYGIPNQSGLKANVERGSTTFRLRAY